MDWSVHPIYIPASDTDIGEFATRPSPARWSQWPPPEPPGAPLMAGLEAARRLWRPVSPTAGVVRGSATMVAADSDNLRGRITALQRAGAACPAGATAARAPLWLRKRATHRAAARRRGLSRPQRQTARQPGQDQLRRLSEHPVSRRAGAVAPSGA